MSRTLGKAEKKDSDRINVLFIEMFQTSYHAEQGSWYLMLKKI